MPPFFFLSIIIQISKMRLPRSLEAGASSVISLFSRDPCLFMQRFHAAPVAKLLKFDLPLHQLFIFIGVIITPLADAAAHRDQPVGMLYLCHGNDSTIFRLKMQ
jgi:hypothetical protein